MDPQQQFCLKWNSFGNNLVNTFDNLFKSASLTDVTLFCEGKTATFASIIKIISYFIVNYSFYNFSFYPIIFVFVTIIVEVQQAK